MTAASHPKLVRFLDILGDEVWGEATDDQRLGVLFAYPDVGERVVEFANSFTRHRAPVFADSGAFSVFTRGTTVDVADYIAWVHRHRAMFRLVANLDVIGDPAGTARNQAAMVDAGLDPLPTFHPSSDLDDLAAIDEKTYIALGGVARASSTGGSPHAVMRWLVQAFKRMPAGTMAHGFGVTNPLMLRSFPFQSVDSTSWLTTHRYGRVTVFHRGRLVQATRDTLGRYAEALRDVGWSMAATRRAVDSRNDLDRSVISIRAFGLAQAHYRRLHRNPDFQIYIAGVVRLPKTIPERTTE